MRVSLIINNIRSCHNVGSLLRTSEGLGVDMVYLTGYTPYPEQLHDARLPHIRQKLTKDIHKTALGAESIVKWQHVDNLKNLLTELRKNDCKIYALEQATGSILLPDVEMSILRKVSSIALLLGSEVEGVTKELLGQCDGAIEIPMKGKKESYNVSVAAGIALYILLNLSANE